MTAFQFPRAWCRDFQCPCYGDCYGEDCELRADAQRERRPPVGTGLVIAILTAVVAGGFIALFVAVLP